MQNATLHICVALSDSVSTADAHYICVFVEAFCSTLTDEDKTEYFRAEWEPMRKTWQYYRAMQLQPVLNCLKSGNLVDEFIANGKTLRQI